MIGYAKFAVIVLLALAAQWAIECNQETVEDAFFTLRCGATNLIGTDAERQQLLDHAARLNNRQCERILVSLDQTPVVNGASR